MKLREDESFREIFTRVKSEGKVSHPRGLKILEIEDFHYDFEPHVRFMNFESRKLNLSYIKKEFLWYLKGDRFDTSIAKHAKLWEKCINKDGSINSNYGQYIFGEKQFQKAFQSLLNDKDSRRASIVILSKDHLLMETNDVCCTYGINFRIREDKLNMSVMMRSQDAIYGLGSDLPCFSFIWEMMCVLLGYQYKDIEQGTYHHYVNSFHVYEKHFDLLDKIVGGDTFSYNIQCPKISSIEEVNFLKDNVIMKDFPFSKWLSE